MTWNTDNRWAAGSSGAVVPEDAPAVYSARWIDQGDWYPADVVPDRQGFAYNLAGDRDRLIAKLEESEIRTIHDLDRDAVNIDVHPTWSLSRRRASGYVYVDAWLTTPPATP